MGKIVFQEEPTPAIPAAGNATLFVDSADEVLSLRMSSGVVVKYTALTDVMVFKGTIDGSTNPNYPAANAGDTYKISVAGKIGGAAGISVEAGDMIIGLVDGSPAGTQAAVGANWSVIQTNIDGAVIGPASATNTAIALYDGTTGKLLKDSIFTTSGSTITGSVTGNAGTVTTNANLTGAVTSIGNATSLGSFSSASLAGALTDETGTGAAVFANSPVFTTPNIGTAIGNITGNAATVTTNANLTGAVTSIGNATSLGSFSSANLAGALTDETGTGLAVFSNSPTLVAPALGTPSALVGTNISGTAAGLTAGTVTTNANLTGVITSIGNATSLGSFTSANLASALTDETGTGANVFATSPTLVTPALGTPSALVGTNITGTASGFTAGTVTTNANLTGAITSVGNATSLGSFTSAQLAAALTNETGTGAAVFATSPTLVTPALGTPASGVATNLTGLPLTTGVTGTLPVANGGTGGTTFTDGGVIIGNAGGILQVTTAGTAGQVLTSNGPGVDPTFQASGSTTFTSSDQTITSAGLLTIAHGLGVVPTVVSFFFVCQTGEFGYTAGDIVRANMDADEGQDSGASAVIDSTNIRVRFGAKGAVFKAINFTTGARQNLTNANWKLRVIAKI